MLVGRGGGVGGVGGGGGGGSSKIASPGVSPCSPLQHLLD